MEWTKIDLDVNRTSQFPIRTIPSYLDILSKPHSEQSICDDYIGGIINDGCWGWLTRQNAEKAELQVYWLKSGDTMASYTFFRETNPRAGQIGCSICAVVEIRTTAPNALPLLAVAIQTPQAKTKLAIYTPICSQVLRYIDLDMAGINAHTLTYLDASIYNKNQILEKYDGCLVLGTVDGSLLLIDLNVHYLIDKLSKNVMRPDCHVQRTAAMCLPIYNTFNVDELNTNLLLSRKQDKHMVLVVDMPLAMRASIVKIQIIDIISGLVAALEDGRIFIYDLCSFQLVAELADQPGKPTLAVQGLCYIMPPDDPQPCFYLCAIYNKGDFLMASLHVVNYQRFAFDDNKQVFRTCDFRSTAALIRLVLDAGNCSLTSCKAVSTIPLRGDNGTLLIAISWHSQIDNKNKLMLFDVNQWYRDDMPSCVRSDVNPNYLCGLVLSGNYRGLDLQLNTKTIVHFAAMRRHDAHFYPNALSFDCTLMTVTGCCCYVHDGVQRRFLNTMYTQKANLFLDPQPFIDGIEHCYLSPQFCEYNANVMLTGHEMYEVVLSVALEQDSNSLLYSCARYCLDGSYMCDMLGSTKLTLNVLTNWIVKRAGQIKRRCSELCQGVFDYNGYPLDESEQKEFKALNAQLFKLCELQTFILKQGQKRFVLDTLESLTKTVKTLCVLYDYQRLLYWFIIKELLPVKGSENHQQLQHIRRKYSARRLKVHQNDVKLYIDEQLKYSGCGAVLQQQCQQDGLYPPQSMQALMLLFLLPTVSQVHKRELVLYLLHDLDHTRSFQHERFLIVDFAKTFDVDEKTVKSVRCFWFLDNGNIKQSVNEFETGYSDWKTKLLVEVLLAQGAKKNAMQVMTRLPAGISSSELELRVFLENNNIPKAIQLARSCMDEKGRQPLLEYFFNYCISSGRFNVVNSLALLESEEQLVYRLLRECKTPRANCAHLIMLLKRHNYIDAVALMNEVAEERRSSSVGERFTNYMNSILSSYHRSMPPLTRALTDKYFLLRDRLSGDRLINQSPVPLSCQLATQNTNGKLGDIFENAVLSSYWSSRHLNVEPLLPLNGRNMPFLCKPLQGLEYCFMQAPLFRSPHCGKLLQEPQPRAIKRKRGAWAEQERKALQDEILVDALLQPPEYLKTSTACAQPSTPQQEQHSKSQSILKKHLGSLATPISIGKTMQILSEQQKEEQQEGNNDKKQHHYYHRDNEDQQPREDEEEEDLDEIIMEIDQHLPSPNQDRTDLKSDVESMYMSQPPSGNTSFVDNIQDLAEQDPRSRTPPTGPKPRSSLLHASSGFGSLAIARLSTTDSLQLNEFVPPVCSSKMGCSSQVKFSERTTIYGSLENPTDLLSHSSWAARSATRTDTEAAPVAQLLDTTLGMSRFDLTALEPAREAEPFSTDIQSPVDCIDIKLMKEEREEVEMGVVNYEQSTDVKDKLEDDIDIEEQKKLEEAEEQKKEERTMEQEVMEQEEEMESEEFLDMDEQEEEQEEEEDGRISINYNRVSSSFNINRELLDAASSDVVAPRLSSSIYSIAESSNSSATSRSPASHTPTSFLPSDTNGSQNSSPREAHGTAGNESNRSLYRANSLETVDDLDTTKGSLEEEDVEDVEDDCVIALDGTEVRGYVARSEPVVASSSDELFAFKMHNYCVEQENPTSSVIQLSEITAETNQAAPELVKQHSQILVDSNNEYNEQEPMHVKLAVSDNEDNVMEPMLFASKSPIESTRCYSIDSSPVSGHTINLRSRSQDPIPSASLSPIKRRLRSSSQTSDEQLTTDVQLVQKDSPISSKGRLRSSDAATSRLRQRMLRAGSMPATSKPTLPMSTPKGRKRLVSKPLDGIQEETESPRCVSEPSLAAAQLRKSRFSRKTSENQHQVTEVDVEPDCRQILLVRGEKDEKHMILTATTLTGRQRRHTTDSSLVGNLPSTSISPMHRRLRSTSQAGDEQFTLEVQVVQQDSPLSSRGRMRSADDVKSHRTQRVLRAGSVPTTLKTTLPVSTPKGRKRLLSQPLDDIKEETKSPRELPLAATQLSKKRKQSEEHKQDSPPLPSRNLRSRRYTQEADAQVEGPKLSDASMPPKKRGRPKKLETDENVV